MADSPLRMNFCRVMAAIALRYRENLAVVNIERDRRYTFPEYHRLINRVANMARDALGLRKGDVALLILDNDNFSPVHFPAIFKQEATFAFSNLRDSREEHARQIDYVKPKGCVHRNEADRGLPRAAQKAWLHDRYLALTPLSHASLMPFIAVFFTGGATYSLNTPDLATWCETVQRERITHGLLVPTLLYRLLEMRSTEVYRLSTLRTLVYGAAPVAPSAVERLIKDFGRIFVQIYGSSEAAMCVSVLNKMDHNIDSEASRRRLGSAGRISPGVELIITDEDGASLPIGTAGEIWIRSRATIGGYYQNPEGTAAEFANGFWKSGDLGYVDEGGYLFIVDRKKDMIITGGFNVYAVEVEAALSAHAAVLMSAVVGVPHPDWGEAVHAEVILREGVVVGTEELIDFVK